MKRRGDLGERVARKMKGCGDGRDPQEEDGDEQGGGAERLTLGPEVEKLAEQRNGLKEASEARARNEKGGLTSVAGKALREAWHAWGLEGRREEDKLRVVAEKFLGKCESPGCRGNTGRRNQSYCPECTKRAEEERRRKGRMRLGTQRG